MWCIYKCVHTHTHTHEYYSVTKKNEISPLATTWIDLEGTMLSKKEEEIYHMISLICEIKKTNRTEIGSNVEKKLMVGMGQNT